MEAARLSKTWPMRTLLRRMYTRMMTNIRRLITLQSVNMCQMSFCSAASAANSRAGLMNKSIVNQLHLLKCAPIPCAKYAQRSDAILIPALRGLEQPVVRSPALRHRSDRVPAPWPHRSLVGGHPEPRLVAVPRDDSLRRAPAGSWLRTRRALHHTSDAPRGLRYPRPRSRFLAHPELVQQA